MKDHSADGISPDPAKIQGMLDLPPPEDTTQLQSVLGMVNFMQPFMLHLSHYTAPLRAMLQKNAIFNWTPSTSIAFQKLKSLLVKTTENRLKYFDRNLPVTLEADASSEGLGVVLLQQGHHIAFASEHLNDTEKRYANIEWELLALIFACERFHTYLYGRAFIAESDHKLLEIIILKNLVAAPSRLLRMLLRLKQDDVTVCYRPGKEMLLVDTLSCLPSPCNHDTLKLDVRIDHHGFTASRLQQLKTEIAQDPVLSLAYRYTLDGWSESRRCMPIIIRV